MSVVEWNPRYLQYARQVHHALPDVALARETQRWPGGKMVGFVLWMSERWNEWCKLRGIPRHDERIMTVPMQDDFDAWLAERPANPRRWRIRALTDDVLNPLWVDVTGPSVEAADEREALEIFRKSDHPRSAWHALTAEEDLGA